MRIAVRAPNWLGDAVMSLPAMADLAATFPEAEIDCFAAPLAAGIYSRFGPTGGVIPLPSDRWALFARGVPRLRRQRHDLGLVLPPSFSSALLFYLGRIRERVGYGGEARAALLTRSMARPPRGSCHASEEYRRLVDLAAEQMGRRVTRVAATPTLMLSDGERERARGLMQHRPRPWVALAPGATYGETKRWPPQRFARLATRLAEDHAASVVLTGSRQDLAVCARVEAETEVQTLNVAGRTDLGTAAGLFAEMDLVVTNDSGAMHLAAVSGAAVVAIFGSTNPAWTSPIGSRVRIVTRSEPCAPCYEKRCEIGTVCLTRITVDEVHDACRALLT